MLCWLHVKIRETRPMGHKLTCGTNLTNKPYTNFYRTLILICFYYNLITYTGDLTTEQTGPWL